MAYETRSFPGNAAETALVADINSSVLGGSIVDNTGWSFTGRFVIAIFKADGTNFEKLLCSSFSGSAFTVVSGGRGYDGTTPLSHSAGETVRFVLDGVAAKEMHDAARKTLGAITAKGDLLAGTGAQALAVVPVGTDFYPLRAHSGASAGVDYGAIPQIASHDSPDTDVSDLSLHHSLGMAAHQAAKGNHSHNGTDSLNIPQSSVTNLEADQADQNVAIAANGVAIEAINDLLSRFARFESDADQDLANSPTVNVLAHWATTANLNNTMLVPYAAGQFTPAAGTYLVSCGVLIEANSTGTRKLRMVQNYAGTGVVWAEADAWPTATSTCGLNIPPQLMTFNGTTDTVCAHVVQSGGVTLKAFADPITHFEFVKIA